LQENNAGELELDIDQLSTDALLKLWDLCKKALPNFSKDSAVTSTPAKETPAKGSQSKASRPKKNKPMSAREQEQKIKELRQLTEMYNTPQGANQEPPVDSAAARARDDSESDSDSEEE
jgi:bromodomain-containing factor 1